MENILSVKIIPDVKINSTIFCPTTIRTLLSPSTILKVIITETTGGGSGGIDFIPIEQFEDEIYIYFVGYYGDDIKCNRWDSENNLEFRLTDTIPTTIGECEDLFH